MHFEMFMLKKKIKSKTASTMLSSVFDLGLQRLQHPFHGDTELECAN